MNTLQTQWKKFAKLPFPKSAHTTHLPLESIDATLAGYISTAMEKGTLEENQWPFFEKTLEQLQFLLKEIPVDAQNYFLQLFEMGNQVLENKK